MKLRIDFKAVQKVLTKASKENRDYLFEHEVYDLVRNTGAETVPKYYFFPKNSPLNKDKIASIPGERVVLKVVSPYVLHKSDVGGVSVIIKDPERIVSAVSVMLNDVPGKFAALISNNSELSPQVYKEMKGQILRSAISEHIKGFVLCQFMPPDSYEFGSELFVSLRKSREFGMIISAGLGGTHTELYAERFKKGQAVVAASAEMIEGDVFFDLFKKTISYRKLAGLTRGQKRVVTDEQLLECFSAFIAIAKEFSPLNYKSPFVIEELEINPFAFSGYQMIPLDGLCRFSVPGKQIEKRPVHKIDKLLHPSSIGVLGASARDMNVGRIILNNIIENGFDVSKLTVIHPKAKQIDGVKAVPGLDSIKKKLDLLVLAVNAADIPALIDDVLDQHLAESVIVIPGGLGEKEGMESVAKDMKEKILAAHSITDKGPVFVGGNSLGILSHPGRFDTLFIPEMKLAKSRGDHKRRTAFISQSGAYMITRMSRLSFLDPAYAISIGNQIDLTASDMIKYLNTLDEIEIISVYMEGFSDLDGLEFAKAVHQAVKKGKQILFYKAGRTPEGKTAMSSHTASIAGDYMVCDSCIEQAGAIVAETFTEFEGLLRLSCVLHNKAITGNRLAAVSNAGYEAVGIADNILGEVYKLEMAALSTETGRELSRILKKGKLETIADVHNPMDITPMATEDVYESVIKVFLEDPGVDVVIAAIVPLSPVLKTLPRGIMAQEYFQSENSLAKRIPLLAERYNKPLVIVVDSGPLYDPLADALEQEGLPVFRSADQAVWVLRRYIQGRMWAEKIKNE